MKYPDHETLLQNSTAMHCGRTLSERVLRGLGIAHWVGGGRWKECNGRGAGWPRRRVDAYEQIGERSTRVVR